MSDLWIFQRLDERKNCFSFSFWQSLEVFKQNAVLCRKDRLVAKVPFILLDRLGFPTKKFCKTVKSAVLQNDRKNIGKRGIRTLGTLSSTHAFQAWTLNHSDIFPKNILTGLSVFLAYYNLRKKSIMEPRKTRLWNYDLRIQRFL